MKFSFSSFILATTICLLNDVVETRENTLIRPNSAERAEHRIISIKENDGPVMQRGKTKTEVSLNDVRQFFLDVWAKVEKRAEFLCAADVVQEQPYTLPRGAVYLANRSVNTSAGPIIFQKHNSSATLITFYFRFVVHVSRARRGLPSVRRFKPMRILVRVWRGEQVRLINYCKDTESRGVGLRCRHTAWPVAKDALCRLVCTSVGH